MHNKKNIIRWFFVIPAAFSGWYLALFIGILLYSMTDYFCSPALIESGRCMATWSDLLRDSVVIFGSGLSAVLTILFSVLVAPTSRILVAKIIYLGGIVFALYAIIETSAWGAFISTIMCGALTVLTLMRKLKNAA